MTIGIILYLSIYEKKPDSLFEITELWVSGVVEHTITITRKKIG